MNKLILEELLELNRIMRRNTFWTSVGGVCGVVAIVIAVYAIVK